MLDLRQWSKHLPREHIVDRDGYLLEASVGRDVLHLGATDAPFTAEKAARGALLHQRLSTVAGSLRGLDSDAASISLLADRHGISDIQLADLSAPATPDTRPAELVICGDIIEHVDNAGNLLVHCNRLCRPGGTLVVSTINALGARAALRALLGREAVHLDHVAYYSVSTLGVLLQRFGFGLQESRFFLYPAASRLSSLFFVSLARLAPATADGLLIKATKLRAL